MTYGLPRCGLERFDPRTKFNLRVLEVMVPEVPMEELAGLSAIVSSSTQYLLIRARKIRKYGGIDLQSDEGWEQIKQAMTRLALAALPAE